MPSRTALGREWFSKGKLTDLKTTPLFVSLSPPVEMVLRELLK